MELIIEYYRKNVKSKRKDIVKRENEKRGRRRERDKSAAGFWLKPA